MSKFYLFGLLLLAQTGARTENGVLPPPKNGKMYVVAHRGAHQGIPENTLAAYRRAIEIGADFVEIDIRTTKDGRLVSIHNREIDAYVKDATGPVAGFTLEELKSFDIGSRIDARWSNERVPTLEEILELCKGRIGVYFDLKEASVQAVVDTVKGFGMLESVIWYASHEDLEKMKSYCQNCLIMPDPGPEEHLSSCLSRFEPKILAPVWRPYSRRFVTACHDAGALVIIDDKGPETWDDLIELGFDGIQTDFPEALIDRLANP